MNDKVKILKEYLKSLGSVAVAFSGGVDSAFLLKTAYEVLGDNAIAVTAHLRSFPEKERIAAEELCRKWGIRRIVVELDELLIEGFAENPEDRCFICKKSIFTAIKEAVKSVGINNIAEGSNIDDNGDYRPGMLAIEELGIKSPLRYAGLNKTEIRELSKVMGLDTWDKPSFACLASRFVYGEMITAEKLDMVERAEQFLQELGCKQVRVRIHGLIARIEVRKDDFSRIIEASEYISEFLDSLGFSYVSLDLKGYRTGSMNEVLLNMEK